MSEKLRISFLPAACLTAACQWDHCDWWGRCQWEAASKSGERYNERNSTRDGFYLILWISHDRFTTAGSWWRRFLPILLFSHLDVESNLLLHFTSFFRPISFQEEEEEKERNTDPSTMSTASNPNKYMVTKNTKFEAKLARYLITDPGDQLLGYDACIEKLGRSINYRLIVLGLESIYLTDNPPKIAQLEQPYLYYRDILRAEMVRINHQRSLTDTLRSLDWWLSWLFTGCRAHQFVAYALACDHVDR